MGLDGCAKCVKYLLFAFNFLFWLLGCAILGVGIWVCVDKNLRNIMGDMSTYSIIYVGAYILIGVGIAVMIIGFLGCCGAIRESQVMLSLFFVCLLVIFLLLLTVGVLAITQQKPIMGSVNTTIKKAVNEYRTNDASKRLMDTLQTELKCCGADSVADYGSQGPPQSCINPKELQFTQGCTVKLEEFLRNNLGIVAGVSIGIGVVMMCGMAFSCILCCAVRRQERVDRTKY